MQQMTSRCMWARLPTISLYTMLESSLLPAPLVLESDVHINVIR